MTDSVAPERETQEAIIANVRSEGSVFASILLLHHPTGERTVLPQERLELVVGQPDVM